MATDDLKEKFKEELSFIQSNKIFSREYRKKRIITYIIRTVITVALYVFFWEYAFIRWSLLLYVPLNIFSIISIYGWSYILKKKINRTQGKVESSDSFNSNV